MTTKAKASHRARRYYFAFNLMFYPNGIIEYRLPLERKR